MGLIDKLLCKHHIGRCTYSVSSGNNIKPEIHEVKNQKGEVTALDVKLKCVCDEETGFFRLDDPTSQIVEAMLATRRINEEEGKRLPYFVSLPKTITQRCVKCGRQLSATITFTLDKPTTESFFQRREKASERLSYGDILVIQVWVDGGYFRQTRSPRELIDLVNPLCNCGQVLHPKNLRYVVKNLIEKINQFWENDEIRAEIKPIQTKDIVKCPFCLLEVTVRAKITPTLPTNKDGVSAIVKRFRAWQNRMLS